jgi:hypothetical protein
MLSLRTQQQAQCRFDQLRLCAALASGLTLELCHNRIVDVEGRLHMENHLMETAV